MSSQQTLARLCEFIVDCEHKTAPLSVDGYPSIRTPNVGRGFLILDGVNRVDERTYRAWTKRAVPKSGDLIVAREAPVGNVAIIPPNLNVCLGQRTVLIRPDVTKVDGRFLCYFLLGKYVQDRFQAATSGATVPHLNMRDIRNLPMPALPPLPEQRWIASILGAYDDLIEINCRRIAALDEMARRIFEEWFVQHRYPGHDEETLTGDTTKLPDRWRKVTLGEVAVINGDTLQAATAPGRIGYVDITAVSPGAIENIEWMAYETAPGRARRRVKDGSIIWSMVRPNRRSFALVLDPEPNTIVSTGFAVLDARSVPFPYLYFWVTRDEFVSFLVANATGAAYPAVTSAVFERGTIVVPPGDLLNRFVQSIEPMLRLKDGLRKANSRLTESRDLLLPHLMSGNFPVAAAERQLEALA